jgi:hypothetical protein
MQSRRILLNVFSSFKINDQPEVSLVCSRLISMFTQLWHPHNVAPKKNVVKQCREPKQLMEDEEDIPPSNLMTELTQYHGLNTNDQFFKNNSNLESSSDASLNETHCSHIANDL